MNFATATLTMAGSHMCTHAQPHTEEHPHKRSRPRTVNAFKCMAWQNGCTLRKTIDKIIKIRKLSHQQSSRKEVASGGERKKNEENPVSRITLCGCVYVQFPSAWLAVEQISYTMSHGSCSTSPLHHRAPSIQPKN
ncbi:hypothetical protein M5D96_008833 [Drosophila gunungcola]|uniref:Uncharacterized protein n=1 Tax=Drosophila gunungcola TaxID=103775 RepID=A0A9Q0BPB0_9MUSC|nr:hypothetical protein M5D96_008833 [Drosophila gunungcola]